MLHQIKSVFTQHAAKIAFCIGKQSYSYAEWLPYISGIRQLLREKRPSTHFVGLAAYDDIETYATILALWAEGYAFVPLSPQSPPGRNAGVMEQVDSTFILSSRAASVKLIDDPKINWWYTSGLQGVGDPPDFSKINPDQIICMLFTSGSTGVPKGVPLSYKNIDSTLDALFSEGYDLSEQDRFLQMFELTFDLSMMSYLPAWCIGASVHTASSEGIRYLDAFKVMQEQEISFVITVPSTLQLLRPYFSQINLPKLRYSLQGGEPFYADLAEVWMDCIPNAEVVNFSGPCETTMVCMGYPLDRAFANNKSYKNILAFGYPWKNTTVLLLNANDEEAKIGEEGELCFAGDHVMEGYWQMPEKNKRVFFDREIAEKKMRFYRTGDMAFQDKDGTYYSTGRKDIQYKIQGYKVELGDIEQHARHFLQKGNAVAFVNRNEKGLLEIHLFIDQQDADIDALSAYLKEKLPSYMQARSIRKLQQLPLTISGKIDRKRLANIFSGDDFYWTPKSEMARRIEDNLFDTYRAIAKCANIKIWQEGNIAALDASPSSWPCMIYGTPALNQVGQLVDNIQKGLIPPQLILKRPIDPEELYYKLDRFGFQHKTSWAGMAIDLLNNNFPEKPKNISLIQSEEELRKWLSIINTTLFPRKPLYWEVIKKLWLNESFSLFGLWEEKEMASAMMGYIHDRGLGLYTLGTLKPYRNQGYGRILMFHLLQDAKERGCQAAYLQATGMGAPIYKKMGYETFCDFDIFRWEGKE